MSKRIKLNESSEEFRSIKKEWSKKAEKQTLDTLPDFLKELSENYTHDYGTICHAISTAAIAAARAMDKSEQGGITGFQAGAIMWGFICGWNFKHNKTGLKIVDYDDFLYPQYEEKFGKTINQETWEALQKEAAKKIEDADKKREKYLADLEKYKKDIAAFVLKYPDYYDRREHYDPLGMGNSEQWEEERIKKESGFEFAPQGPCEPLNDKVYQHWASIASGSVPFGYEVCCD